MGEACNIKNTYKTVAGTTLAKKSLLETKTQESDCGIHYSGGQGPVAGSCKQVLDHKWWDIS
jgi:hypothetical protein